MYRQDPRKQNEDVEKLFDFLPITKYEEIYSNHAAANRPRTAQLINDKINKKENILILIETRAGNKFGAYFSSKITVENRLLMEDPNHVVFTISNNMNIKPKVYKRREDAILPLLCLCTENSEGVVLTIPGFCWISDNQSTSYVYRDFANIYDDEGDTYAVFCKDEMKVEKKENASVVNINCIRIFQLSMIPQNYKIELHSQNPFNKERVMNYLEGYGKATIDITNNIVSIVFENSVDAAKFMRMFRTVGYDLRCSVQLKSI